MLTHLDRGIMPIQVSHLNEKDKLELTGQQGDVMKESMKCAKTMAHTLLSIDYPDMVVKNDKSDEYISIVQPQVHLKMDHLLVEPFV